MEFLFCAQMTQGFGPVLGGKNHPSVRFLEAVGHSSVGVRTGRLTDAQCGALSAHSSEKSHQTPDFFSVCSLLGYLPDLSQEM